jgi:outer membrane assembly lipoprotein YfiO
MLLILLQAESSALAQWIWSADREGAATVGADKHYGALKKGFDQFEKGDYKAAFKTFKRLSKKKKNNPYRDTALFMAGQSLYMMEDYNKALKYFEEIAENNPASTYMGDILQSEFDIAGELRKDTGGFLSSDKRPRAIRIYEGIIERAPYGTLQASAQLETGETYFDMENYFEAQLAYEAFIELYKDDPRLRYAELKRSVSLLKQARGPEYDPVPFVETKETIELLLALEKDESKREHYQKLYDEAVEALAEKNYSIASFYLRTGEPEAALVYFESVVEDYPDTEWAARAQKRADEIARAKERPAKKKIFSFRREEKESE